MPNAATHSTVSLIRTDRLSAAAEYAYAATVPAGARLVFLAGACPLEMDRSTAAVGEATAAIRDAESPHPRTQ